MDNQYDVVVIGAGNGGLVSACVAAKHGLKTLLVEKHNLPGGLATSFVRGRFEFEVALHELSSVGTDENPGGVRRLFDMLGVEVDWCEIEDAFRLVVTDEESLDFTAPFGVKEFTEAIEKCVPGSKESVSQFLRICKEVVSVSGYINTLTGEPDIEMLKSEYPNFVTTSGASVKEVEDHLNMPEKARHIVNVFWSYLGLPSEKMDFHAYATVLYNKLVNRVHIPSMRSHEMATAIEAKIRDYGGTIKYNTSVTQINVEDGSVVGVTLSNGKYIATKHVIANVTPHIVYGQLIPEGEIPKKQLKMANSRDTFISPAVVYLGLNKSAEELGLHEYGYFIYPTGDDNELYKNISSIEKGISQASVCLNAGNPNCSPEGTCIVYLFMMINDKAWNDVQAKDYFKLKEKIAKSAIEYFERALNVQIKDFIEEMEVATPVTIARYTGNYQGEILGYLTTTWDSMTARSIMSQEDNSIKGLRFSGKAINGGYAATLMSGLGAGNQTYADIVKERKQ